MAEPTDAERSSPLNDVGERATASVRDHLANERTMLAWVRTGS
jgi:uncharacterized membrane protein YidH (DUF202 family)